MLRVVVLLNALALYLYRAGNVDRPALGVVVVAVMVIWTALATWAYAQTATRTAPLLLTDLAVALGALLVTPVVKGDDFRATVPGFWVMAALLAWAVAWHWVGGLIAGVALSAADLGLRLGVTGEVTQANYGNVFLLLVGGPIVGFMVESLQQMATERDRAERSAAAAAERARLARAVHDGVLQVLTLVQRRGREIGGEAAELGRLAGEQEAALRNLIRRQDAVAPAPAVAPTGLPDIDLAAALSGLASGAVSVATPAEPVLLPAEVAAELVAVVEACLDNVARHVGPDAPAWVLLESLPGAVELTVRDDGPGIPEGRLEAAAAEGRLGVSESIRGRIADLGGTATLTTGEFGTEWEISVPAVRSTA